MLAKMSYKNQLTLPKKVVAKLGFSPAEERYLDIELQGNLVILKPVTVTIEEKISEEQWDRFKKWALDHSNDISFSSLDAALEFLEKRSKKK